MQVRLFLRQVGRISIQQPMFISTRITRHFCTGPVKSSSELIAEIADEDIDDENVTTNFFLSR